MTALINPKLHTKDYQNCFEVSSRTAQRMLKADKVKTQKKCFTALDFFRLYGFQIMPISAILCQL